VSSTTAAKTRPFVGIELHQPYLDLALRTRLAQGALLGEVAS
jgi:hypothetical protein